MNAPEAPPSPPRRSALALGAVIVGGLLVALVLPPSGPAWLFWTALVLSSAAAFAWGFLALGG